MFVQVIKGKVGDVAAMEARARAWRDEVRPGAIGFLGSTGGVTDDGTLVIIARFADEASARANSERPEQSAWWEATAPLFDGEPTFRESADTAALFDGGSDRAGFVQVMEGTVHDRAKLDALQTPELEAELKAARPDLLGGLRTYLDDGSFVEAAYFTAEDAARSGETSEDFTGPQAEFAAIAGVTTYHDLRNPIFA